MIKVLNMSGRGESKLVAEDVNNHTFSVMTGFRLALNSFEERNHMRVMINRGTEAFEMPRRAGIINLDMPLFGGRRILFKCISSVGSGDNETMSSGQSKEVMLTRLFNAGGIGLSKLMKPGSHMLGAINKGITLARAIREK
jgi:hypothetical protein